MKKSTTTHKPRAKKQGGVADGMGKSAGASQKSKGEPIARDEEIQENNDEHIDQDFPGYPHHPSRNAQGRTIHNGSAGAFDATEHSHDEEDEDQDSDDFAMER